MITIDAQGKRFALSRRRADGGFQRLAQIDALCGAGCPEDAGKKAMEHECVPSKSGEGAGFGS